jgi:hypothetical protein
VGVLFTGPDSSKILAQNVPGNQSWVAAFSLNENGTSFHRAHMSTNQYYRSQSSRRKSHKQVERISLHSSSVSPNNMSTKDMIKTINQQQYV